jgi:hypothetical protein
MFLTQMAQSDVGQLAFPAMMWQRSIIARWQKTWTWPLRLRAIGIVFHLPLQVPEGAELAGILGPKAILAFDHTSCSGSQKMLGARSPG